MDSSMGQLPRFVERISSLLIDHLLKGDSRCKYKNLQLYSIAFSRNLFWIKRPAKYTSSDIDLQPRKKRLILLFVAFLKVRRIHTT